MSLVIGFISKQVWSSSGRWSIGTDGVDRQPKICVGENQIRIEVHFFIISGRVVTLFHNDYVSIIIFNIRAISIYDHESIKGEPIEGTFSIYIFYINVHMIRKVISIYEWNES